MQQGYDFPNIRNTDSYQNAACKSSLQYINLLKCVTRLQENF